MIESEQPLLGQWHPTDDTYWDGLKWVSHHDYMISLGNMVWGLPQEPPTNKAEAAWAALESMF